MLNLRSIRERNGVSLRGIAQQTKIRTGYLEAIEAENFSQLPGQIYTVSYIRQYARAIDYEEGAILDAYFRQTSPLPPPPARPRRFERLLGPVHSLFYSMKTST